MSFVVQREAEALFPKRLAGGKTDYLAWAKQLVYRAKHGDKSVSKVQLQQAQQAVNNSKQGDGT